MIVTQAHFRGPHGLEASCFAACRNLVTSKSKFYTTATGHINIWPKMFVLPLCIAILYFHRRRKLISIIARRNWWRAESTEGVRAAAAAAAETSSTCCIQSDKWKID